MDELEFYLEDLKSKFLKINPSEYYLSYSGGKDSHFIFWFLREWLKGNDYEMYEKYSNIKIVGINTYMEHSDILKRINENCDIVLRPDLKPFEIKEKYGIPCFSKYQDEMISRYNNGCRSVYLMEIVTRKTRNGEENTSRFVLNKQASRRLLEGDLHKVSNKCCEYLKKRPAKKYTKESKTKPILGVRGQEGILRKSQYKSCFKKDGTFTPLWDLSNELIDKIYKKYNIELPDVYDHIKRTGCMGCPYGNYKGNTEKELSLLNKNQTKFVCGYFKESYDVLGINYQKYLDDGKKG